MEARPLKFFAYSPMFGNSHTVLMGALCDALIDKGHEVVLFAPLFTPSNGSHGTTRARIIEYPTCRAAKKRETTNKKEGGIIADFWKDDNGSSVGCWDSQRPFYTALIDQLNELLDDSQLIERLRAEKFDAAFTEVVDSGAMVLMHLLGITRYALAYAGPTYEWGFYVTGAPAMTSYVPGILTDFGESMSFMQRLENLRSLRYATKYIESTYDLFDEAVKHRLLDYPGTKAMFAASSLFFLNTDPLFDFPRPTVHKMIEIGGISVECKPRELNQYFSSLLSLRASSIFICFGSVTTSVMMPVEWKATIVEVARRIPDTTFIWKYERPSDFNNVDRPSNLVCVEWAPQADLLHDPRLSLFITHAGMGSVNEALRAGIRMIAIPVKGDQFRNAKLLKRTGAAVIYNKFDLAHTSQFERVVKEVLKSEDMREAATRNSLMLRNRPFSMKELFVRNMEFMARFGPLRMLDHHGRNLNTLQYYNLDLFIYPALFVIAILSVICTFMHS
ncbi:hypothetical protein PRIPAC_71558 [Pristionchus pacificus]|nr:hypothetical protein PRIPAC_71558 [Pristionchus pacificus]